MLETARALRDLGVQVRVLTPHAPGSRVREEVEGIEVIRARYLWPERWEILLEEGGGLPAIWRRSRRARLAFLPFFGALTVAVMRHARDCDVIHAHWTLSAMAAWLAQGVHRRPIVLTVHGSDVFQAPRLPLVGGLTRATLRRCRRVIAVSAALAEATVALGLPPERMEVLPDGIDVDRFTPGPAAREPLLLFVGSLIERKGAQHLLDALPDIAARFPEVRLAIVGDGPQRSALEQQARALGLADRVEFVGFQSQAQIAVWMRRARLFVLPSLEEALGIVLLEALASGTPCVASRVGGIPEVVTPEVGRVVPPADPASLSQAIVSVLADPQAWAAMHQRARPHVLANCYTWRKVALRLQAIYAAVREAG